MTLAAGGSQGGLRVTLVVSGETKARLNGTFQEVLGRPADADTMAWMQATLAAGVSQGGLRATLAASGEARATLSGLYEYALGRAPSSAELAGAQAGLGGSGSLRGVYDGQIGPAAAGLVGDAGKYEAALRQLRQPGGGTGGAGSAAGRALQGVLAWAGRNGPALTGAGVTGVVGAGLLMPFNAGQQAFEVGVVGHADLGARVERAPGQLSGTVVLYERGSDGQPEGAGLRLNLGADGRLSGPGDTPFAGLWFGTLTPEDMTRGVRLPPGFVAAIAGATPEDVEDSAGGGLQTGYSFELRTQEEADVVAALRAQGKGVQEIQAALDDMRAARGGATGPGFPLTVTGQVPPTPRDGIVGGVPTGRKADETRGNLRNRSGLQRENQAAVMLAAAGYRVEQNPSRRPYDDYGLTKEPDQRVGEHIFDVYSPNTNNLQTIRDELSRKSKDQARRIVINLARSEVAPELGSNRTPEEIREFLTRKPVPRLYEVLVIDQDRRIIRLCP